MKNLKEMLEQDSYRWQDPKYCGVLVTSEDLVEDVVNLLRNYVCGGDGIMPQRKEVRFETGARLIVRSGDKDITRFQQDHCGMQYTSIMVDQN